MQISFKTHKILKWLERELVAVLAVGFLGLGSWLANAETSAVIGTSLEIVSGGEVITVTSPNGGEGWEVGSIHNVTWTGSGSIANVMIELQRTVAGSWETIVASTANDGSYPWTVAGSATTTATIRISKTGDATVNDVSDAIFSITEVVTPPTSGGGGSGEVVLYPAIDNVTPSQFSNQTDTILQVKGVNFAYNAKFYLNKISIPVSKYVSETYVELRVPAGMVAGKYQMSVYNTPAIGTTWGRLIEITQPIDFYEATLVGQSDSAITMQVGQTKTIWVEYRNTGTLPWYNYGKNPVRLGTSMSRDRHSDFRSGWYPYNRPAKVMLNGISSSRSVVNPGEVGRFTFKIKAPKYSGHYIENFETVVEYIQWMPGISKLEIDVTAKPSKAIVKMPGTGGNASPALSLPEGPTTFYDGFETFLRGFLNVFDRLLDSIGRI